MNIRTLFCVLTAFATAIAVSTPAFANDPFENAHKTKPGKWINWKNVEYNYVKDLKSDNIGVRISAANNIGEYHLEGAMGPLTDMLNSDKNEVARLAAALALARLGEPEAFEALEFAAKGNGNMDVAQFCRSLISASGEKFELPLRYNAER
jgi:HEAT repeats